MKTLRENIAPLITVLAIFVSIGIAYGSVVAKVDELETKTKDLVVLDKEMIHEQKLLYGKTIGMEVKIDILMGKTDKILDKLEDL